MSLDNIEKVLEAAIFSSPEPLTFSRLKNLFVGEEVPDTKLLREALTNLEQRYRDRGIALVEVSSGYRFQTQPEYTTWIDRLWEKKPPRYTRATLETLVLIAYQQPITRGEIEDVRGVAVSSNIIKNLLEREWIQVLGHKEVPGKPALFGTTKAFLDYFNLKALADLPALQDLVDLDAIAEKLEQGGELELAEAAELVEELDTDVVITDEVPADSTNEVNEAQVLEEAKVALVEDVAEPDPDKHLELVTEDG